MGYYAYVEFTLLKYGTLISFFPFSWLDLFIIKYDNGTTAKIGPLCICSINNHQHHFHLAVGVSDDGF